MSGAKIAQVSIERDEIVDEMVKLGVRPSLSMSPT